MTRETISFRRSKLYGQVWSQPLRTLANRLVISDVMLGRICRKHNIPEPGVGYWAKVAAAHSAPRKPLPALPVDVGEEPKINFSLPGDPSSSVDTSAANAPQSAEIIVVVPAQLVDRHPLVAQARDRLQERRAGDDGLVRCTAQRCLSISVSPASLDRALRIMDALIKTCEQQHLAVEVTPPAPKDLPDRRAQQQATPPNTTRVLVDDEWIGLRLVERCDVVRDPAPTPPKHLKPGWDLDRWTREQRPKDRFVPNGGLQIILSANGLSPAWRDYRRTKLESRVGEIVAHLKVLAGSTKAATLDRERRHRKFVEEQRRQVEEERRASEEQRKVEEIRKAVSAWRFARDLREYVADARAFVETAGCSITPGVDLAASLGWVYDCSERIDPLASLRRELATHVAKRAGTNDAAAASEVFARQRHEARLVNELLDDLERERRANDIRRYLATIQSILDGASAKPIEGTDFDKFMRWSAAYADRIDPHSPLREQIAQDKAQGNGCEPDSDLAHRSSTDAE